MATSKSTQDLQAARQTVSFSPEKLNALLNEGSRDGEMRTRIAEVLSKEAAFDKSKRAYMSRKERLAAGLKLSRRLLELCDEQEWGYTEYLEALATADEPIGMALHEIAFQPVISSQCSDEQQAIWLPKCYNHEILGCYMQTELGHGSNVQQLETTATYDIAKEEFVINSPTISSTKWWIGGLGMMATHGVVQARLILKGKDMGPHLFICQLRSLEDHSLMPNLEIGEIGPKVHGAMAAVDNGWARFSNVRIPRSQMLARFARVEADGTYNKPPHDKLAYGGMIFIRAQMIGTLAWKLAKAVTISTRYAHVRRQFADPELKPGQPEFGIERQVVTYPGVYMRLLPQIARAYVFVTAGKDMAELYYSMASQLATGDASLLAETHAVSSGLKTYVSAGVVDGVETVRRAMGGHGFLDASGVGRIFANELPSVTYEGDNYILHLQVARSALKTLGNFMKDPKTTLSPSSAYFSSLHPLPKLPLAASKPSDFLDPSFQLQLISLRAALSVSRLARLVKSGKKWSELSHECVDVSRSVTEAFLVRRMLEAISSGEGLLNKGVDGTEKEVLRKLVGFYVLHTLEAALPSLLEFGILAASPPALDPSATVGTGAVEALREQLGNLAKQLLPEMVGLVDAFGFSDWELDSAAGKKEGQAYETMLQRAKNDLDVNVGDKQARKKIYDESIKPILERGKRLARESKL